MPLLRFAPIIAVTLALWPSAARADSSTNPEGVIVYAPTPTPTPTVAPTKPERDGVYRAAEFASQDGNILFLASGILAPSLRHGGRGRDSVRALDATVSATAITDALKRITRQRRPDGSDRESFPSGHATAAFAVATMAAHYDRDAAPFWYLGATLIAASRVKVRRHYARDVVAGAAVGHFTARAELRSKRGLLLFPFVRPRKRGRQRSAGFAFSRSF